MTPGTRLLIVGFGAFGHALGNALSLRKDISISVLTRQFKPLPSYVERQFVEGETVPVDDFDVLLLAVPSTTVGAALSSLCKNAPPRGVIVSCAKGMDPEHSQFVSQVIHSTVGTDAIAVLAGASFAHEMMEDSPVFLTLACTNSELGSELVERLQTDRLRLELATDVRGMEIVGVAKNVLAVGAGIADGLNLGENFRASFIAKGVAELFQVVAMLGGDVSTISRIGALGDIILTCSSDRSRNYRLGRNIAASRAFNGQLAEGKHSAEAFVRLLDRYQASSKFFRMINRAMDEPRAIIRTLYQ